MARQVKIAAMQMIAHPASTHQRLERAEALVAGACRDGAQLVVLPEVFNTGYEYSDQNYGRAEPLDGPTVAWMKQLASRNQIHLAGTLLLLSLFSLAIVPGIFTSSDKVTLLISGLVAGALVGIFEELGWTGFAVPRLRLNYGVLATGLIVGFVWGLWHMPLFTESARVSQSVSPFLNLAVMSFSFLPAFRVLMVWVYDRTGSLLVAMLMHASQTATTLIFAIPATDIQAVVCNLVYTAALWTFVAVVTVANRGQLEKGGIGRAR